MVNREVSYKGIPRVYIERVYLGVYLQRKDGKHIYQGGMGGIYTRVVREAIYPGCVGRYIPGWVESPVYTRVGREPSIYQGGLYLGCTSGWGIPRVYLRVGITMVYLRVGITMVYLGVYNRSVPRVYNRSVSLGV